MQSSPIQRPTNELATRDGDGNPHGEQQAISGGARDSGDLIVATEDAPAA